MFHLRLIMAAGVDLACPKYWIGQTLERWPVYLRDRSRAYALKTEEECNEIALAFKGEGFCWEFVPA